MVFNISKKYSFIIGFYGPKNFIKKRYWVLYFHTTRDNQDKRQYHTLVLFGLTLQLIRPYSHVFSYKNMPKIGKRKV